jgi:hypothetical protein
VGGGLIPAGLPRGLPRFVGLLAAGLLFAATPALADPPPAPVLSVPGVVTSESQSRAGARVSFSTSGTDWRGQPVPVACEPVSGSLFPLGQTRVVCTATDRRHQSTTESFPLTVEHLYRPGEGATVPALRRRPFAWYPVEGARYYNLQLWRQSQGGWKKIASVFPSRERFVLEPSWVHQGRRYRLAEGSYRWFAWPWLGSHYGPLLGRNTFFVR